MSTSDTNADFYDVLLSFAGEQREYVRLVAESLAASGLRVFYDDFEEHKLWGENLTRYLDDLYQHRSRYCVVFISADYERKLWTSWELNSVLARAFADRAVYMLPARFDDTVIAGITPTTGYVDLRKRKPVELANLIRAKVSGTAAVARPRRRVWQRLWRSAPAGVAAAALGAAGVLLAVPGSLAQASVGTVAVGMTIGVAGGLAVAVAETRRRRRTGLPNASAWASGVALCGLLLGGGGSALALQLRLPEQPRLFQEVTDNGEGTPLYHDAGFRPVSNDVRIPNRTIVDVRCKVPDTSGMGSVTHWYLIDSVPWSGLYAPSDTFANGDDPGTGGTTSVDPAVPDC